MRYLPHTEADRDGMLRKIGVGSIDDLFVDIPADKRLDGLLDLPRMKSEIEVERHLGRMAARNIAAGTVPFFVGAGAYRHHVPSSVDHLIQRSEFLTSYTPYQPEVSHTRTVPVESPAISRLPSGVNRRMETLPRWPSKDLTTLPVAASNRATRPAPPTARVRPSGLNATAAFINELSHRSSDGAASHKSLPARGSNITTRSTAGRSLSIQSRVATTAARSAPGDTANARMMS